MIDRLGRYGVGLVYVGRARSDGDRDVVDVVVAIEVEGEVDEMSGGLVPDALTCASLFSSVLTEMWVLTP